MPRSGIVREALDARFPGWVGLHRVLPGWQEDRAELMDGGWDVLFLGDSIPVTGDDGTMRHFRSTVREFQRQVQTALNPVGFLGGAGYISSSVGGAGGHGNGGNPVTAGAAPGEYGNWSVATPGRGVGGRHCGYQANTTQDTRFLMNGTDATAPARRWGAKEVMLVGRRYPGGPVVDLDISTNGTTPNRNAGAISADWNTHHTATQYGARSAVVTGLGHSQNCRVVARGGANAGDGVAYLDGAIFFGDDREAGIRVHDLCNPGSRLDLWTEESLQASVDAWGTGAVAARAKWVFISFLVNDANAVQSAVQSQSGFEAAYAALIQRALALPSQPNVVLLVPSEPSGAGVTFTPTIFASMRSALYELAATSGPRVALFDLGVLARFQPIPTMVSTGCFKSDGVHLSDDGHTAAARLLAAPLIQV